MGPIGIIELIVLSWVFIFSWGMAIPFCKLSQRLGYAPWWGLITAVPLGVVVWAFYVAFSRWPNERKRLF